MKPFHVFLCLTFWRCINAVETECSRLPDVGNADILNSSLKTTYTDGDLLHFSCRAGYVSSRRITFKCNDRHWTKTTSRNVKCSRKQCELPEDISNGYYNIVNGTDFVFGTVIKYTCNEGYMLVGRPDTRLCLSEGWSDRVPSCEVVKCWAEIKDDSMIVSGLGDDSSVNYGHVLHFKCASSVQTLKGEPEVACLSNGKWSSSFPKCGGTEYATPETTSHIKPQSLSCGPPPFIPHADIKGLRKDKYKDGDMVEYQCMSYYEPFGRMSIKCNRGNWENSPTCLEPCIVTLEEMEQRGIRLKYGKTRKLYVKDKDRVQFICIYGKKAAYQPFIEHCNNGTMNIPSCQ
ncbi:hypothetical protein SKAU_G00067710 [Synaphobranchus kaupii]|uniref:Sushi domain-containing protein n=1 Tax=Synaphobranchus kaupii TaxID=118154 RepID=A0A9Q1G724_SYNKA|nr:hypothetical protein SKAU_G00067710 [Synaphobranchus kaupii]